MISDIMNIIKQIEDTGLLGKAFSVTLHILVAIVIVYKPLNKFWRDVKLGRVKKLEEALNSPYLDENTKKFIEANLSEEQFKLVMGMSLSHGFRIKLMELYYKDNSPIAFMHYERVINFMEYKNGEIQRVKIPKFVEILGYCMVASGLMICTKIVVLAFFVKPLFVKLLTENLEQVWWIIGFWVVCAIVFVIGFLLILQSYGIYYSAKLINKQIGGVELKYYCWYYQSLNKKYVIWSNQERSKILNLSVRHVYYVIIVAIIIVSVFL